MQNDLVDYVSRGVQAYKGRWRELAKKSGVSYSWITKRGAGVYKETNHGVHTLEKVAAALRAEGFQ